MQNRNQNIDLLRGIAILFVILLHLNIRIPFNTTELGAMLPTLLYKVLFWSGWYGVSIFFVISGFLITTSALNKWNTLPKVSITGFYKMRIARILPLLVALLVVLSAMNFAEVPGFVFGTDTKATLLSAVGAVLTFSVNWLEMQVGYLPPAWDVLWSLSIEEVFYLAFPIVCLLIGKERYFVWLMLLLVVVAPLFRTVWFTSNELSEHNNFACMDGIALGCLGAIAARRATFSAMALTFLAYFGWALLILVVVFRSYLYKSGISGLGLDITILSLGVSMLLVYWQKRQNTHLCQKPNRVFGWLSFFGTNSYEVYLTHMFVVMGGVALFNYLKPSSNWVYVLYLTTLALSGALGHVVAHYYSNPINKHLRQRAKAILNPQTNKSNY